VKSTPAQNGVALRRCKPNAQVFAANGMTIKSALNISGVSFRRQTALPQIAAMFPRCRSLGSRVPAAFAWPGDEKSLLNGGLPEDASVLRRLLNSTTYKTSTTHRFAPACATQMPRNKSA
jgi:hypothetical protein